MSALWRALKRFEIIYPCMSMSRAIRHVTPLFMLHFPVIGSGGASVMYGASSRNVIFRWNFSGTPCGGVWLSPGHTMSLMYSPSRSHDFQTPICNDLGLLYIRVCRSILDLIGVIAAMQDGICIFIYETFLNLSLNGATL